MRRAQEFIKNFIKGLGFCLMPVASSIVTIEVFYIFKVIDYDKMLQFIRTVCLVLVGILGLCILCVIIIGVLAFLNWIRSKLGMNRLRYFIKNILIKILTYSIPILAECTILAMFLKVFNIISYEKFDQICNRILIGVLAIVALTLICIIISGVRQLLLWIRNKIRSVNNEKS